MSDAFRLVGLLFVRSVPTIIFVIILVAILNRLFFGPIEEVMRKRAEETVGALARARGQIQEAEAKSRQYEAALQAARIEIYSGRQAEHQASLAQQENALRMARDRAETLVKEARAALASEVSQARQQLSASCPILARAIAEKLLRAPDASGGTRA
jgi:F-type H+-transporting ATPase subunit b